MAQLGIGSGVRETARGVVRASCCPIWPAAAAPGANSVVCGNLAVSSLDILIERSGRGKGGREARLPKWRRISFQAGGSGLNQQKTWRLGHWCGGDDSCWALDLLPGRGRASNTLSSPLRTTADPVTVAEIQSWPIAHEVAVGHRR